MRDATSDVWGEMLSMNHQSFMIANKTRPMSSNAQFMRYCIEEVFEGQAFGPTTDRSTGRQYSQFFIKVCVSETEWDILTCYSWETGKWHCKY